MYISNLFLFLFSSLFILVALFVLFLFFAYICYIIGQTSDDAKVFGEIYWEENDIILVQESRLGIGLKTI